MVPQTLEPVMGGREGLEVTGFLERNLRGRVKRESDREGGSDKCKGVREGANVKCFTKILSVKYFT